MADAQIGVVCRGGGCAANRVVGKSSQRGLCSYCCSGSRCGQSLQLRQRVHAAAVVGRGCNGGLHIGQVIAGDAGDGQRLQLGQAGGRAASCSTQHRSDRAHHRLQLGRGVGGCCRQCGHGVVDGGQVTSGDSADTGIGVHAGRGGAAAAAIGKGGQRGLRSPSCGGGGGGHGLQFSQCVDAAAVVRGG